MTDTSEATNGRRLARLVRGRLWQARWLLAAAVAVALLLHLAGGGSGLLLAAAVLLLLVAASLAPRRVLPERPGGAVSLADAPMAQGLSADRLAAAVADPLIVFDRRGVVTLANSAAASAFGDVQPGISMPLKFRAPEMQDLIEAMLSDHPASTTVEYTERVPIERVLRVTATPVGRGTGLFVIVFKDQSESRRIDRMRADFIANASHELRTPLASIAGFVETLRGPAKNDTAAREQFLQIMQNQTARMARLIDDLLSLSRLEMKAMAVGGAKVDLRQVIESVVDSLKPLAAESGVVIENRLGEAKMEVPGDRDELFQVFENLVENACKYGQSGGRVVLSATHSGEGEVAIEVRDFGPGIPEEHIPRITERFYRADVENSRSHKGTGLGLSIVKHILTRHKGRLSITSKLGEGAAFTVHLPAR
ncbi:ATP-binding protein [Mesorhizobium sp. LHD-90]|uniref:ATP-binding protein n=1 Tax=Mesorhizobium sp. LHD-90 TaxID=3071414 RepID=UPI0027E0E0CF|nr:ATP-binding protein [Mesorhizobium sp. LHD-90]MDQ6437423.1 ATP-binding protein [Mesorhizobium sp. LHD-90]